MRDQPLGRDAAAHSPPDTDDWERHWRVYARSAAANPAQEFRRRLIVRLLEAQSPPSRILDVGSGTGDLALELRHAFPDAGLLGIELSRAGVELSRAKVPGAVFLQRDLLVDNVAPTEHAAWATHAVCSEVLEHLDDPRRLLTNAFAYMAPGCLLVVTVPGGPITAYDRHIGHRRHFTPDGLAVLLRSAGFDEVFATGAGFPFFNAYRLFVYALGSRLVTHAGSAALSPAARASIAVFGALLRRNVRLSDHGWQVVATARARA